MCVCEQLSISKETGTFMESPDFCRIFNRQLSSFYRLAFLLTTSHSHAEQCTLASLDQALNATGIASSSAESWSKRAVIQNALRMGREVSFAREATLQRPEAWRDDFTGWPFDAIISLHSLERFVFVLSVLEKISDSECSQLLGCAVSEIAPARICALESLSTFKSVEKEELVV